MVVERHSQRTRRGAVTGPLNGKQASSEVAVRACFVPKGEFGASPDKESTGKVVAEPGAFKKGDGLREGMDGGGWLAEYLDLASECQDLCLLPTANARVGYRSCLPSRIIQVAQGFLLKAGKIKSPRPTLVRKGDERRDLLSQRIAQKLILEIACYLDLAALQAIHRH